MFPETEVATRDDTSFPWSVREDGVVVLPTVEPEQSKGGVYIPDQARQKPLTGVVVALGPGKIHEATGDVELYGQKRPREHARRADFSVGDEVLFGRYAGTELEIEHAGRKLVLMRFGDIRAYRRGGSA